MLVEDKTKAYVSSQQVTNNDIIDNKLIFGDNLLALKAMETEYKGKVKCVYIDPPYNTKRSRTQYTDTLNSCEWLRMMRDRLQALHTLLSNDGSLWVSIDENELAPLMILLGQVFGPNNKYGTMVWKRTQGRSNPGSLSISHEYILVYAKDLKIFKKTVNRLPLTQSQVDQYKNPNNDPRGPWKPDPFTGPGEPPNQQYPITSPNGAFHYPPKGRSWRCLEHKYLQLLSDGRIYFGVNGDSSPKVIVYLKESKGVVPSTWWDSSEVGSTSTGKKESIKLFGRSNSFSTCKPEKLVERILHISSNPGDLVLDCFAGSGTTGSVAHKMGRHWIMAEIGEHCHTHIIPRLKKVIDGDDLGGISKDLNWQGGGGFRYYEIDKID